MLPTQLDVDELSPKHFHLDVELVILTHRRPDDLRNCLQSILEALEHRPKTRVSITFIINGFCAFSENVISDFTTKLKINTIRLSEAVSMGAARNRFTPSPESEWTFFLDDDVILPRRIFHAIQTLKKTEQDIIGGPNLSPVDSNFFQKLTGLLLASSWGAWASAKRYKLSKAHPSSDKELTLCNLLIRNTVLKKLKFPDFYTGGEENFLLANAEDRGYRLFYSPRLYVWHKRRDQLSTFLRQIFKYGSGRGQCIASGKFSFFHFVPFLFLCSILLRLSGVEAMAPLHAIYLTLNLINGLILALKMKSARSFVSSLFLFPLIHLLYGAGTFSGLIFQSAKRSS